MLTDLGKIVAIGGGEIGKPGYPIETATIDKEIIRLSGKRHPHLLFIPTASRDAELYVTTVKKYFGRKFGCRVDTLFLLKEHPTRQVIKYKIHQADIIYVGGGDTLIMLKVWHKYGVDRLLREAYRKGTVLSGISAGAICWFRYGSSGTRRFQNTKNKTFIRVKGLGLVNLTISPHHLREQSRRKGLITIMRNTPGVGIALDDYSALQIIGEKFRIITSQKHAKAYKVFFQKDRLIYQPIRQQQQFQSLTRLLKKSCVVE